MENDNGVILNAAHNSRVDDFVIKYKAFGKKSAEATLELCAIVLDACQSLQGAELTEFRTRVGLTVDLTLSKYTTIGERRLHLEQMVDRLPHCWTSIYKLAALSPEQLDAISDQIRQHMTGEEIDEVIQRSPVKPQGLRPAGKSSTSGVKRKTDEWVISIRDVPDEMRDDLHELMHDMSVMYGFVVQGMPEPDPDWLPSRRPSATTELTDQAPVMGNA